MKTADMNAPEAQEQELEIVTLITDDNEEEEFWHVMTFPYEGSKYSALVPVDEIDSEEPSVIFVKNDHDKSGDMYIPVENEVLLEELMDEFSALLDEQEEEDEE